MIISDLLTRLRHPKRRLLCFINHYHDPDSAFKGKSTTNRPDIRRDIVLKAIDSVRQAGREFNLDLNICGIPGYNLVDLDIPFRNLSDPRHLIYASIEHMASQLSSYDYFLNIEDDIYLPHETLIQAIDFNRTEPRPEVLHPNRIERTANDRYCVDLKAVPGWTTSRRTYRGRRLAVAINPHSALMFFSRAQFAYAIQQVDMSLREHIIGDFMASAYCNIHAPFTLWRSYDDLTYHIVEHLDHWRTT